VVRNVEIESERLADIIEQMERYGPPDKDVLDVVELLADLIDDRNHGRDLTGLRARIEGAVAAIGWTW
jgi:hypothetical protein